MTLLLPILAYWLLSALALTVVTCAFLAAANRRAG